MSRSYYSKKNSFKIHVQSPLNLLIPSSFFIDLPLVHILVRFINKAKFDDDRLNGI